MPRCETEDGDGNHCPEPVFHKTSIGTDHERWLCERCFRTWQIYEYEQFQRRRKTKRRIK